MLRPLKAINKSRKLKVTSRYILRNRKNTKRVFSSYSGPRTMLLDGLDITDNVIQVLRFPPVVTLDL